MKIVARSAVLLAALTCAQAAGARTTPVAPPGNPSVNQYVETLPGPSGNEPIGGAGQPVGAVRPPGGPPAQSVGTTGATQSVGTTGATIGTGARTIVPRAEVPSLIRHGQSGRLVLALRPVSHRAERVPPTPVSPPVANVGGLLVGQGSGGMGLLLPVGLGVSTLAAVGFAIRRRRSR